MKRLVLTAAVLVLAACASGEKADTTDTAAVIAPAPVDSAALRDSITRDSVRRDSVAKDSAAKAKKKA